MNDLDYTVGTPNPKTRAGEPLSPDALELIRIIQAAPDLTAGDNAGMIGAIHGYMDMRRRLITSEESCPDAAGEAVFTYPNMYAVLWSREAKFHGLTRGSLRNRVRWLR